MADATRHFRKYHGLGNDFIIVDARDGSLAWFERHAIALCDRHRGIGADGVLFVSWQGQTPAMRVINADGSVPEMCGNGLRCVVVHLADTAGLSGPFEILTDAGPHRCERLADGRCSIDMRPPSLAPQAVAIASPTPWIDAPFAVDGETLHVTAVSMGNPHGVFFDASAFEPQARQRLGPRIGADRRFEQGVNVGFARVNKRQQLDLHVHERGVGWTQACGTGACAAAVAAVETGRADRGTEITVHLPGGALDIVVDEPGQPLRMTGPAVRVYEGQCDDQLVLPAIDAGDVHSGS